MASNRDKKTLWRERIAQCRSSGLAIRKWCQDNNVAYASFQYWHAKIRQDYLLRHQRPLITRKSFTELNDRPHSGAAGVEITIGKATISLHKGFDESVLKSCLCILGG
jgi:hypothetical protein